MSHQSHLTAMGFFCLDTNACDLVPQLNWVILAYIHIKLEKGKESCISPPAKSALSSLENYSLGQLYIIAILDSRSSPTSLYPCIHCPSEKSPGSTPTSHPARNSYELLPLVLHSKQILLVDLEPLKVYHSTTTPELFVLLSVGIKRQWKFAYWSNSKFSIDSKSRKIYSKLCSLLVHPPVAQL